MTIPESVRTLVTTGPLANPGSPLCAASLRKSGRPIGDDRGACPVWAEKPQSLRPARAGPGAPAAGWLDL